MKKKIFLLFLVFCCFLSAGCAAGNDSATADISASQNSADSDGSSNFAAETSSSDDASSASDRSKSDLISSDSEEIKSDSEDTDNSDARSEISGVEITFDYSRAATMASNQVALWVTDSNGKVIKTIYVSDFTGTRRGYTARKDALKHWVKDAKPSTIDDEKMDAISSATLSAGSQSFTWDMTDQDGNVVSSDIYTLKLEGTLYWGSNVLYTARIDLSDDSGSGDLKVQESRSEPDNSKNEEMITNVKMRAVTD